MSGLDDYPRHVILPIAEEYGSMDVLAPIEVRLHAARVLMRGAIKLFPENAVLVATLTTVLQCLREPDPEKGTPQ